MNLDLQQHDKVVELHYEEADALCHSLGLYLYVMVIMSSDRPLYKSELFSYKPATKLRAHLSKMQLSTWPRNKLGKLRPRRWKLQVEEVILLNRLMVDGELFPAQAGHYNAFNAIYGKINVQALTLTTYFEL